MTLTFHWFLPTNGDSREILGRASATLDRYGIRTVRRSVHATTAAAASRR